MKMEFDAVGLMVRDMERMTAFYRDVMGMQVEWNGGKYAEVKGFGARILLYARAAFEEMTDRAFQYPKGLNGTMEISFSLPTFADVDVVFRRLTEAGAKPVLEPLFEPWGQRTSYIADPDGNLIELSSFQKE